MDAESGLNSKPVSGLFLLSVLSPIVTIYGVLSFVSGWSFLVRYFGFFGLTLGDADIGLYGVLIHGLSGMAFGWGRVIILFFVLVGALVLGINVTPRSNRAVSLTLGVLILVLIGLTSWAAGSAGITAAQEDAGARSTLPNVTIIHADGTNCQTGKLLRRKDTTYFVVRIHACNEPLSISTGVVTTIPSDVVLIDHYVR